MAINLGIPDMGVWPGGHAQNVGNLLFPLVKLSGLCHLSPMTSSSANVLAAGLAQLKIAPTAIQQEQLAHYAAALRDWNQRINLIAESTVSSIEGRHILDSAQLVPLLPLAPSRILDIGSGAGLPGLILAILAPQHQYTLAEKVGKKAAFLQAMASELKLPNVIVHPHRAELLARRSFNLVTCRAFAALVRILEVTKPLLARNGSWLLLKGEAVETELAASPEVGKMTVQKHASITSPLGVILQISPSSTGNGYNPRA